MKKRFAVFGTLGGLLKNRSDLPEMTLPLVVLVLICAVGSLALAAGAMLPFERGEGTGPVGVALAVVLAVISVTSYALLIILWRRLVVIAVAPLAALVLYLTGASLFTVTVASLSFLFLSYTLAVSVLGREGKYQRVLTLTLSTVAVLLLGGVAWIGLRYDSFDGFRQGVETVLADLLRGFYEGAAGTPYTQYLDGARIPSTLSEGALDAMVADVFSTIPAYLVMAGLLFAGLTDGLLRFVLTQLDAIDDVLPRTHRITLPKAYAILHLTVTVLLLLTSPERNPLIYAVLRSLFLSMVLPCLSIGCVKLRRGIMIRLYFLHGKRAISTFLVITLAFVTGISAFSVFVSLAGAVWTLRFHRKMESRLLDRA